MIILVHSCSQNWKSLNEEFINKDWDLFYTDENMVTKGYSGLLQLTHSTRTICDKCLQWTVVSVILLFFSVAVTLNVAVRMS